MFPRRRRFGCTAIVPTLLSLEHTAVDIFAVQPDATTSANEPKLPTLDEVVNSSRRRAHVLGGGVDIEPTRRDLKLRSAHRTHNSPGRVGCVSSPLILVSSSCKAACRCSSSPR